MITNNSACSAVDIIYCEERKPYIIFPNNLIVHIIRNKSLNYLEKAYYLIADLYSNVRRQNNKLRETEKSGKEWAKLLDCSEEWVFKMQKKLETLGYFQITREKDQDNQNEKNIIIPTLPDDIFYELAMEPNRQGKEQTGYYKNEHEGYKRSFLDDTKMFIPFNLKMIKSLLVEDELTSLQKLIWVYCFSRSHISYTDSYGEGTRNFITTYQELALLFSCEENTVSIALNKLFLLGYISKKQFRIKEPEYTGRRKKKSCWEIAALFPQDKMETLLKQPDRSSVEPMTREDLRLYNLDDPANNSYQTSCSNNSHERSADSHENSQYYNKNNKLDIKNNDHTSTPESKIQPLTKTEEQSSKVFFKQDLLLSQEDLNKGLSIAKDFYTKAVNIVSGKNIKGEEISVALEQLDRGLTKEEHWLMTKIAHNLYFKVEEAAKNFEGSAQEISEMKYLLKQTYSDTEQRLIMDYEDLIQLPIQQMQEMEEMQGGLRVSWLVKLFPDLSSYKNSSHEINLPVIQNSNDANQKAQALAMAKENATRSLLPGDKEEKARSFAVALKARNLAKGYAAEIGAEELGEEFVHHAATWCPSRLECKTKEQQIDAALSFAWRAVEQGKWRCPYSRLNAQILQREQEAARWKNY